MTQQPVYFRPPSEASSLLIPVMRGCPHNRCTFCNIFKNVHFQLIPLEEILKMLDADAVEHAPVIEQVKGIYLEGGDPMALNPETLEAVMKHAHMRFPHLEHIACYATARSVIRRTPEQLKSLADAGLRRVYIGLESGLDDILKATRKGCTSADLAEAGRLLSVANIENDVSIMLGIGGKELSRQHALATAELFNLIEPACVRICTFVPKLGTHLGDDFLRGHFTLMGPHDILHELRLLVEATTGNTRFLSSHWTNFIRFDVEMPRGKNILLELLDAALEMDESQFRPLGINDVRD
ncbi:radical SAM protein [Desulfovibrio sp. OttesenSCG-928-C06]|nr:radical SAM protein [Desulfovibrio sp. OttesenSCG-928-C06]